MFTLSANFTGQFNNEANQYFPWFVFQIHTFVLQCNQDDTLARIRAHLLHMLYEMGRDDHQFRLRFKGQFLRDAYTLEDYHISEYSVLKMVPMARRNEVGQVSSFFF